MTVDERELRNSWTGEAPEKLVYDGIERPQRGEDRIRRAHDGRPYIRVLDDEGNVTEKETRYSRVTTYIKCVDDPTLLHQWTYRQIALGIAMAPDVFLAKIMMHQEDRNRLNKVCEEAKTRAAGDDQAAIGTAVHALTEQRDLGWPLRIVPAPYQADLAAWIEATQHFRMVKVEQFMVNDDLGTAGTPDRVVEYHPCANCGKRLYILDLKTGRVDNYTELQIAMQMGLYNHSNYYDLDTGRRETPEGLCQCKAIIVALPAGTGVAATHWVDTHTGWEVVVEVARRVREARRLKRLMREFVPVPDLFRLIDLAETRDELTKIYHENRGIWTPEHTSAATTRVGRLSAPA